MGLGVKTIAHILYFRGDKSRLKLSQSVPPPPPPVAPGGYHPPTRRSRGPSLGRGGRNSTRASSASISSASRFAGTAGVPDQIYDAVVARPQPPAPVV